MSQRKSRGKPQVSSVEPPSLGVPNWQLKKGNALVQSPALNTTYVSN
jgi:hypothetical protein